MENNEIELKLSEMFYTILEESTDVTQKKMNSLKAYYDSAVLKLAKTEQKKDIISLCKIINLYETLETILSNMILNYETCKYVFEIKNFSNMLYIIYQYPGIRHIDLAKKLKLKSPSALSQLVNKTINYGLYIKEYNAEHKIASYNLSALGKKFVNDHKVEIENKLKIEFDFDLKYFEYLRKKENYKEIFIFLKQNSSLKIEKAILTFLSCYNFEDIMDIEEDFVIEMLKSDDIDLQEQALNAILCWEKVSNVEKIKDVKIKNRYLDEDLQEFIEKLQKNNSSFDVKYNPYKIEDDVYKKELSEEDKAFIKKFVTNVNKKGEN